MKKLLFLPAFVALATLIAAAKPLTPDEALARALSANSTGIMRAAAKTPTSYNLLQTTDTDGEPTVYVFGKSSGDGYLLVSADEAAAPLLGYSESENFDSTNPGLSYWLQEYNQQIAYARRTEAPAYSSSNYIDIDNDTIDYPPIERMLRVHWSQLAPYNNMCPMIGDKHCATGCVATAAAQVMFYHRWPKTGTGEHSYVWRPAGSPADTLSLNFSDINFDWSNMRGVYSVGKYNDTQAHAVGELMYAIGVAVNMNYGLSSSGAVSSQLATALTTYFGYNPGIQVLYREYYGIDEWNGIIYNQLVNYGPVLYTGQSRDGGHEFVVDGYSEDGFFHINWGWAEQSDGFYLLTALDPEEQGTGGSSSGYNFNQMIIANVKPAEDGDAPDVFFTSDTDFIVPDGTFNPGDNLTFKTSITASSRDQVAFKVVLRFMNSSNIDDSLYYSEWPYDEPLTLESGRYFNAKSINTTLPDLPKGVYLVEPVIQLEGDTTYRELEYLVGVPDYATAMVEDSTIKMSATDFVKPTATDINFDGPIITGQPFTLSATIDNPGTIEYFGTLYAIMLNDNDYMSTLGYIQLDIEEGDEQQIEISGTIPTTCGAGLHTFYLMVRHGGYLVPISATTKVEVLAKPTASASISAAGVSFNTRSYEVSPDDLNLSVTVTCDSGIFYGPLTLNISPYSDTADGTAADSGTDSGVVATYTSDKIYLAEGESTTVTFHANFSQGTIGQEYEASIYNGATPLSVGNYFVLGDIPARLDSIAAGDTPVTVAYYTLTGVKLPAANLIPGHYIKATTYSSGNTITKHEIIR